jgi:ABC-type Mn2+/Zn2+ transport system permease subunit
MLAAVSLWQRFLEYEFYQNALAAGVAIALLCGALSVFVVLRGMAFIGQGVSHAAFGGAGLALLLGLFVPALGQSVGFGATIAVFCVATAVLIGWIARSGRVDHDSAIGICLVAAMAAGVILLDLRSALYERAAAAGKIADSTTAYTPGFHDLLFGNILSIPRVEVWLTWAVALIALVLVAVFYKELVFLSFDAEAAEAFGVRTSLIYYGLLIALGITIVLAMRLLGVILASALLILPGVAGRFWSRRVGLVTLASILCSLASVVAGLALSVHLQDFSTGPVIVLTLCAVLAGSYLIRRVRTAL